MPPKPPSLAVLVAITTLNPLALNILQPALPELARTLATDYGTVQLTLALFLVASAVSQIALGPISDQLGRRPVALAGVVVFLAGSAICFVATSVPILVVGRIVQAVGGVTGFVISRAVVRDLHGRDASASKLGYITMAMVIVPMLSPLVGGWLSQHFGYASIFAFCGLIGLAALIFALIDLTETRRESDKAERISIAGEYAVLLRSRAFIAHSLTLGLTSATFFTFLAGVPYVAIELQGTSPAVFGVWWVIASIAFMLGNYIAGRLGERIGSNMLVRVGTVLPLIGLVLARRWLRRAPRGDRGAIRCDHSGLDRKRHDLAGCLRQCAFRAARPCRRGFGTLRGNSPGRGRNFVLRRRARSHRYRLADDRHHGGNGVCRALRQFRCWKAAPGVADRPPGV